MPYQRLTIFVEGDDDSRFFENVIKPMLEGKDISVDIQEWSQKDRASIKKFIRSIKNFEDYSWDYIFTSDIDCFGSEEQKIRVLIETFDIEHDKVVIVIKEIEGWYLAGLTEGSAREVGLNVPRFREINPDTVIKEHFVSLMPKNFIAKRSFYSEILKHFDHETAIARNGSYQHFSLRYDL